MEGILDSSLNATLQLKLYRYRFVLVYVLIGFGSLCIEVLLTRGLHHFGVTLMISRLVGLVSGIFFAFWMNVRFNFKVPIAKRNNALLFFAVISCLSVGISFVFRGPLLAMGWSYEGARFVVSGALFVFAYMLHRQFSFADRKQVGVAVYANGVEDIHSIRQKIGDFPDFIHVDLIDSTFGAADKEVRSYRLEAIRAYWPRRKIHVHLMTQRPLHWLDEVLPFADLVILHAEADDDIPEAIEKIRNAGCNVGLCLQMATPCEAARRWISQIDVLMLLTIATPGRSGQTFELTALDKIREVNTWPERDRFAFCIDGGVNEANIHLVNVELVVSGSSVLTAPHPMRQIMRLQTSNNHEAI